MESSIFNNERLLSLIAKYTKTIKLIVQLMLVRCEQDNREGVFAMPGELAGTVLFITVLCEDTCFPYVVNHPCSP